MGAHYEYVYGTYSVKLSELMLIAMLLLSYCTDKFRQIGVWLPRHINVIPQQEEHQSLSSNSYHETFHLCHMISERSQKDEEPRSWNQWKVANTVYSRDGPYVSVDF